jgi:hypothetical protein
MSIPAEDCSSSYNASLNLSPNYLSIYLSMDLSIHLLQDASPPIQGSEVLQATWDSGNHHHHHYMEFVRNLLFLVEILFDLILFIPRPAYLWKEQPVYLPSELHSELAWRSASHSCPESCQRLVFQFFKLAH